MVADWKDEVRRACAKYAVSWHPITYRTEEFAAGMKRAAKILRRRTKAYRRAVETALRGWSRRREQAGFMCKWSRVKCRDTRPVLRMRDCRWSQTR